MEFCPTCANLLQLEHSKDTGHLRLYCPTCPYVYRIDRKVSKKLALPRKQVDDVLGGDDAWKNVDRIEVSCPKCGHNAAYFMQIQIRSADEPMSTFFKCCNNNCTYQWREG
eukprot:TRINITY_DN1877_c0_g1_i6.p1 TRINITY_DN1877_c0_g1~~TRINITY_DN1877_c0_g1_i6.p1  ORF type:complete len:111 (+),score=17.30 TRINITY_DN1877_c0_g1_i6:234-566(+)